MAVKCYRCGKIFSKQYFLNRHLERKFPCKLLIPSNTEVIPKLKPVLKSKDSGHICNYCKNIFSQSSSLYRHLYNNCCKVKTKQDNEKEKLFMELITELENNKREITELKKQVDKNKVGNNINNSSSAIIGDNNIVNNTVTFNMVAFGKEDLSHLTLRDWKRILGRQYKSIEDLIIKTHFDKDKPEHQNIYISNLRSKYIMIHDGKNWIVKNRKDTVDDLYDEKAYIIFNKVEELTGQIPIKIVDKFNKIKTGYDEDDIRKALIKDIDLVLYNQRNIPIYTHIIK